MRIRNVKNKDEIMKNTKFLIIKPNEYIGKWNTLFDNNNPIYIEIGMGKGDFIIEHALKNPNINYIGIEKFDSIIVKALTKIPDDIKNLYIVRANALTINEIFENEVDLIFLNFSDPWPKFRHHFRRLTSKIFLDKYDKIFKDTKVIEMKTDNTDLFSYSVESLSNHDYYLKEVTFDLHRTSKESIIMTEYEKKFVQEGKAIYYMKAISKK